MRHKHRLGFSAAALISLSLAACSDDDDETVESIVEEVEDAARTIVTEAEEAVDEAATDAAETAVRNIAAEQGEEQFADAGHPLDDEGLSCTATASDGLDSVSVQCTGTTDAGEQAELTGETAELPGESVVELEGTFTGTVAGSEVFSTDVLGG
jgi:hypothetical protein